MKDANYIMLRFIMLAIWVLLVFIGNKDFVKELISIYFLFTFFELIIAGLFLFERKKRGKKLR